MANKPLPAPAQPSGQWHLQEVHALTQEHGVDPAHGLHVHQVNDRALQFGPNALPTADQRSLGSLVLEQFSDFMILVLLAAAVISGVLGDLVDTLVILVIVLINAAIGLVQSWRADQALAALQRLSAAQASVLRGGQVQQMPAHVLVPGDIVLLEAGNQVELRVHELAQLFNSMDPTPFHSKALDRKAETFVEAWARGFYTIARERLTIAGGGGGANLGSPGGPPVAKT